MLRRSSIAVAAIACSLCSACHEESTTADFTGLNVVSSFAGSLPVARLRYAGTLDDGSAAFMSATLAIEPVAMPPALRSKALVILMPASLAGFRVHVSVDGESDAGAVLVSGEDVVRLSLGNITTTSVALGSPAKCGDGSIFGGEECDDGDVDAGDGCDAMCKVERGFVCAESEPSRCFDAASAVFADAAASCGGDGSAARPFCTIGAAVNAPRAAAVIAKRGLFREQVIADHVRVDLVAEPGAVLESMSAPALLVSGGSIVRVQGLVVRGLDGMGGGVAAEGQGSALDLDQAEVGPGGAIGVEARDPAVVRVARSVIRGNRGGGVRFDSSDSRVENSVIAENGSSTAEFGGIALVRAARVVNVTIVANSIATSTTTGAGVSCSVPAAIENSIVWGNIGGPPVVNCLPRYSDLGPFEGDPGPLDTNFSEDPKLSPDFHLGESSPCKDRGDPTGVVPAGIAPAVDIDGDARPRGDRVDVGADEL